MSSKSYRAKTIIRERMTEVKMHSRQGDGSIPWWPTRVGIRYSTTHLRGQRHDEKLQSIRAQGSRFVERPEMSKEGHSFLRRRGDPRLTLAHSRDRSKTGDPNPLPLQERIRENMFVAAKV